MGLASSARDGAQPVASSFTAGHQIGVLRWQSERHIAALLARAFLDDPLVTAIYDAARALRQQRMAWGFRVAVRGHCLAAQPAWTVDDDNGTPLGIVLVTRQHGSTSQAAPPAPSDSLFALRGFWHLGLRASMRSLEAAQVIGAHVPAHPFTYLRTLGVEPKWHGRGFGSRLVEHVIGAASADLPIYLETAKERNLSFYRSHGFTCIGTFPCLGVPIWRLLRAPRG